MADIINFQAHNFDVHRQEELEMRQHEFSRRYADDRFKERFEAMDEHDLSVALNLEAVDSQIGKTITNCLKAGDAELMMEAIRTEVYIYLRGELVIEGAIEFDRGER